jgi:DNA replication protein DnaC
MEYQRIDAMLRQLHLPRMRNIFVDAIERCSKSNTSFADFLGELLEEELTAREERRLGRLMQQANFPFEKTLEQFDFRRQPELRRQVFQTYLDASFVNDGRSLVLIGPPGLGKTHLAVAVGIHMVQRWFDVRCVRVQEFVNRVMRADGVREREKALRPYLNCSLLILDELGYLMPEPGMGPILYELIAQRYEKRATIITSNKALTEWGKVFQDGALASALVDRLMHHGDVYYLKGQSYRLKDKQTPPPEPPQDEQEA